LKSTYNSLWADQVKMAKWVILYVAAVCKYEVSFGFEK
jgi:hypothetical protein